MGQHQNETEHIFQCHTVSKDNDEVLGMSSLATPGFVLLQARGLKDSEAKEQSFLVFL
jgi:hypothetical protein